MSIPRRRVSPIKNKTYADPHPSGIDEREQIIGRLKEQLIVARGKEKEILLLEKYLSDLETKNQILNEEIKKKDYDVKTKSEANSRAINELKREL